MNYRFIYVWLLIVCCTACRGQNKSQLRQDDSNSETKGAPASRWIYTKYEYADALGKSLIIQNSLPKGWTSYTDRIGEVYSYIVFFTRISNETDNILELKMQFPLNAYAVPSLPGKYENILIPPYAMTVEKEPLYNYGLPDLKPFLDSSLFKPSSFNRTIGPKESSSFYVVILCLREGAGGVVRTGLSLKGQDLFYSMKIDGSRSNTKSADKEIHVGSINLKNLVLKK